MDWFFFASIRAVESGFPTIFPKEDGESKDDTDLEDDAEAQDAKERSGENSQSFMGKYGWLYQIDLVAELERVKRDDVFNMDLIPFLADLLYIKEKAEFVNEINRQVASR
jgi:hypothetical protein